MPKGIARLAGGSISQRSSVALNLPSITPKISEAVHSSGGFINRNNIAVVPVRSYSNYGNQVEEILGQGGLEGFYQIPVSRRNEQLLNDEIWPFDQTPNIAPRLSETQHQAYKIETAPGQFVYASDNQILGTASTLANPQHSEFYKGKTLSGTMNYASDGTNVLFSRDLADGTKTYETPSENPYLLQFAEDYEQSPITDLLAMSRSFNNHLNGSEGHGLYFNTPVGGLEGKRAKAYSRMGFVSGHNETQYLDNRRPANQIEATYLDIADQRLGLKDFTAASRLKRGLEPLNPYPWEQAMVGGLPAGYTKNDLDRQEQLIALRDQMTPW
jgi:hypothetical protein